MTTTHTIHGPFNTNRGWVWSCNDCGHHVNQGGETKEAAVLAFETHANPPTILPGRDWNEPLDDQWMRRDLPVLRYVTAWFDSGMNGLLKSAEVSAATRLSESEVLAAGNALQREGYVRMHRHGGLRPQFEFNGLGAGANEAAGLWPTPETATNRIIAALEQAIRDAKPEDRTRLQKLRDMLLNDGRVLGVGIATAAITGTWG